jgi:hypothetical protein
VDMDEKQHLHPPAPPHPLQVLHNNSIFLWSLSSRKV